MKIAVAGATGRVGGHAVDVLEAGGHEVVPMSRSTGVDVITREGLAEALAGVEAVVDAATGPSPAQDEATRFFTTAARNLQEVGARAGVKRIVVVSIIGTDRFTAGYGASKLAHEQASLAGSIPVHILRAAQFHEFVSHPARRRPDRRRAAGRPGRRPRLGCRTLLGCADLRGRRPTRKSLVAIAKLLVARRGDPIQIEGTVNPGDPDHDLNVNGALLPGPDATRAGPTFEEWLDSTP